MCLPHPPTLPPFLLPHPHLSCHTTTSAYLTEDSAHLEERTAESERIIATLVSNLEPQPPKDDVQRMVCNGSNEELQLQLSEVHTGGGVVQLGSVGVSE